MYEQWPFCFQLAWKSRFQHAQKMTAENIPFWYPCSIRNNFWIFDRSILREELFQLLFCGLKPRLKQLITQSSGCACRFWTTSAVMTLHLTPPVQRCQKSKSTKPKLPGRPAKIPPHAFNIWVWMPMTFVCKICPKSVKKTYVGCDPSDEYAIWYDCSILGRVGSSQGGRPGWRQGSWWGLTRWLQCKANALTSGTMNIFCCTGNLKQEPTSWWNRQPVRPI